MPFWHEQYNKEKNFVSRGSPPIPFPVSPTNISSSFYSMLAQAQSMSFQLSLVPSKSKALTVYGYLSALVHLDLVHLRFISWFSVYPSSMGWIIG